MRSAWRGEAGSRQGAAGAARRVRGGAVTRSSQRGAEARRELSPGARDGWVGDREQVGDLDGGEGRVGGGHDGADGHERVVQYGDEEPA